MSKEKNFIESYNNLMDFLKISKSFPQVVENIKSKLNIRKSSAIQMEKLEETFNSSFKTFNKTYNKHDRLS